MIRVIFPSRYCGHVSDKRHKDHGYQKREGLDTLYPRVHSLLGRGCDDATRHKRVTITGQLQTRSCSNYDQSPIASLILRITNATQRSRIFVTSTSTSSPTPSWFVLLGLRNIRHRLIPILSLAAYIAKTPYILMETNPRSYCMIPMVMTRALRAKNPRLIRQLFQPTHPQCRWPRPPPAAASIWFLTHYMRNTNRAYRHSTSADDHLLWVSQPAHAVCRPRTSSVAY
jgi:hypothetical protein